MNTLICTTRKPFFWLVRETAEEKYSRSNQPYTWQKEKIAVLLAMAESLNEILEDDIRGAVPPHREDLELLNVLKHGLNSFQERE